MSQINWPYGGLLPQQIQTQQLTSGVTSSYYTVPNSAVGTITVGANGYPFANSGSLTTITAEKTVLVGEGADVVINGVSLSETLAKIQERLAILKINPELEQDFQELAELGQKYREVEARLQEAIKILDILGED